MKKLKRNLLLFSGLTVTTALVSTAIACSNEDDTIDARTRYEINSQAKYETIPYTAEHTASYGGSNLTTQNLLNANLISQVGVGEATYKNLSEGKFEITNVTQNHLELTIAKDIRVTKSDGSVVIYDNDKHEIDGAKNGNFSSVMASSADTKSINHPNFLRDLSTARKLQISVKSGIKWVDWQGNATKYEVKIDDFWYSFVRTKLLSPDFRRTNGGSKEIDKNLVDNYGVTTRFKDQDSYPNEYLFSLFGVDSSNLVKRDTFIEKVENIEYLTFNPLKETADFANMFLKTFVNNSVMAAAPSEYIKENYSKWNADLGISPTGLASEMAIYSYGLIPGKSQLDIYKQYLYAGPYYMNSRNSITQINIFKKNKHFVIKSFADAKNVVNEYVEKYVEKKDSFASDNFLLFKAGDVAATDYTTLKESEKAEAKVEWRQYNVPQQRTSLLMRTLPVVQPSKLDTDEAKAKAAFDKLVSNGEYKYYNDNFAKLMWGATAEELLVKGTKSTTETFYHGTGLRFRTLFQAAWNFAKNVGELLGDEYTSWTSRFAPDGLINAKSTDTIRQHSDQVNIAKVFDKELNSVKFNTSTSGGEQSDTITPTLNTAKASQGSLLNEQYKTYAYDVVKAQMKILLDDFYQANNLQSTDKIKWAIIYPWTNPDAKDTASNKAYIELVKSLDSRLEPWNLEPKDTAEFYPAVTQGKSQSELTGWGYDYDGIGSGIIGLMHSDKSELVPALAYYALLDSTKPNPFPEVTKFGKALQKAITDKKFILPSFVSSDEGQTFTAAKYTTFEQLASMPSDDGGRLQDVLSGYKTQDISTKLDFHAQLAEFVAGYANDATTDELIKLAGELTILQAQIGPVVTRHLYASKGTTPTIGLRQAYLRRPIQIDGHQAFRDMVVNLDN
ncbi:OppA family ABC transporter substrate-binding lipoprotein [Mycoplasmopsis agassizii]|uniref:Lipoprotein n=1 Tax=Mycoplasmopsis agassizii TaxID=33922 RepID=A0ABX4H5R4_9BACT|nr:hypothetical protein [Mycoplasmopsis agassizii]PAF55193.1 hypothetical protein CJF60_00705 [Mycoplasmopsis agassizii]SMC19861.1 hypothetical protein SAMN02745179_00963 [Mycoplasmopsis agassizii]